MPRSNCIFTEHGEVLTTLPRCLKDEKSPVLSTGKRGQLSTGKRGQLQRANSCRVVSVIQKSSDLLDIVAIENGSNAVGSKLATSRSCLALNEIEKIGNCLDKDSMSSGKSIHDLMAESFLRKDSEAESGFIEAEADFENETTKTVPYDSFESLPPLEQRRQIRIHELFESEDVFTKAFDDLARNIQASMQNIKFNGKSADSLKALTEKIVQIAKLLNELSTETAKRKALFPLLKSPSQNDRDYYIDVIGLLHARKIAEILETYEEIRNLRTAAETRIEDSEDQEIVSLCNEAIDQLPEHFLHLQLGLKYVLYCTPRKHMDYRPLRDIIGELDNMNRSNFDKKADDLEKERADSCPLYDKRSKSSIIRRYSWDNQTLKKITNISRSLTFMKTSTRNSKAETKTPDRAETPKGRTQSTSPSIHTWHSTPKSRKSLERTDGFYSTDIKNKDNISNGSVVSSKDQNCHAAPEKCAGKRVGGSKLGNRKTCRVQRSLTVDSGSLGGKKEDYSNVRRNDSYIISFERTAEKQNDLSKSSGSKVDPKERSSTVDSSSSEGKKEENCIPSSRRRNNSYIISCEGTTEKQSEISKMSGSKGCPKERSWTVDSSPCEDKAKVNFNPGSRQRNNSYKISCEGSAEKQNELSKAIGPKVSSKEHSLTVDSSSLEGKIEDGSYLGSRQRNDSYRMSRERTTEKQNELFKASGPRIGPKECSSSNDSCPCERKLEDDFSTRRKISCKRTDSNKATEHNTQFRNRSFAIGSRSLDYRWEENERCKQSLSSKGSSNCVSKEMDYNCSRSEGKRDLNSMRSDHYEIDNKESFDCTRKSSNTYCDKNVRDSNHRESFDLGGKSRHSYSNKKPIDIVAKHNCNERVTGEVRDEKMADMCRDCLFNQNEEAARRSGKQTEKYSANHRKNQEENSGINSNGLQSRNFASIPDASPRILRETIPESSPSLIRNNLDYFSYSSDCDTTPRIEVESSNVETRSRSSVDSIYDNDIDIDDIRLDFLGIPTIVGSPADSYTSDEDSQLDRYISKMVNKSAGYSSSRVPESGSRGQDRETAQFKESNVRKRNNLVCNSERLDNRKLISDQFTPSQNGFENKQNRNGVAESISTERQPFQEPNSVAESNPRHEQKSKFRSKSPKLSVTNSPSLTHVDGRKVSLPEDSRKGIKLSVARAKKKLLDFTSPRISRKKEKYFQSLDDSELYAEEKSIDKDSSQDNRGKESPYPICTSSPLNKKEINFGSSDSSCSESQRLSQNGHIQSPVEDVNDSPTGRINVDMFPRRSRERDKIPSTSSGWSDLGQSNLSFDRKLSSSESTSAIDSKSNRSPKTVECRPITIGCDSFDELSETTERARSPSIVSNLSISSHFNLTVKRILETSELDVTRVGNSVFYCTSRSVKSVEAESSSEVTPLKSDSVPMLNGGSEEIAENEVVPANGFVPCELKRPLVAESVSTSEKSRTEDSKLINDDLISKDLENPKRNSADADKKPVGAKAAIGHMAISAAIGHVGVNAAKGQMATSGVNMHVAKDFANMVLPIVITKTELGFPGNGKYPKPHNSLGMDPQKVLEKGRKVSKNRVVSWGENLDSLLTDKDGVKIFQLFLKSEYSEENLLFWLACESFKSVKSTKINREANKIVKTFIENFSSNEVNLDHDTRMKITQTMSSPCKNMFSQAQTRIKQLMAQDSYPRFIRSSMYQNLLYPNRSQAL